MHEQQQESFTDNVRQRSMHKSVKEMIQNLQKLLQQFPLIYVIPRHISIESPAFFQARSKDLKLFLLSNYGWKIPTGV